ncbi:MAG: hypothetical protein P8M32_09145 [Phycisphaerales bacterium]|jgi:hypothetical protein|nr:hypothetical protein [Phycisphaerales bacterium]
MQISTRTERSDRNWGMVSMLFIVVMAFGLRWGTQITQRGPIFDERWITRPIADLIRHGWSVERAIDFQETKGPALIWPYAVGGRWLTDDPQEIAGPDAPPGGKRGRSPEAWDPPIPGDPAPAAPKMLASLRLISLLCFVLSVVPLLVLASACGIRGPPLLAVTVLFTLLPQLAIFSQIVMGEASFVLLALVMLCVVVWGCGVGNGTKHPVAGPILYAILLGVLLHSRIHAAPLAVAVALATFHRESWRSWPWWVASVVGGLVRLPLWIRWGGPVSSDFQQLHGVGLRLESLTYLAAAMALPLAIFLVAWVLNRRRGRWWWIPVAGMGVGVFLSVVAPNDLSVPSALDLTLLQDRYQGAAATAAITIGGQGVGSAVILGILAVLGLGGLGALLAAALDRPPRTIAGLVLRMQAYAILCGWLMYAMTRGFVFDRYLLVWCAALPIAWVLVLPRPLVVLQFFPLVVSLAWFVYTWLY